MVSITGLSEQTVCNYTQYFRQLVTTALELSGLKCIIRTRPCNIMTRTGLPPHSELSNLFENEDRCIQWLKKHGCFDLERNCPICGTAMVLVAWKPSFRCLKRTCRKEETLGKGSFFASSKLPCSKILQIAYFWLQRIPTKAIISMTSMSEHTVCNFSQYFRQLACSALDLSDCVIGGEGIIVEIDESKFGKRKNHRGHRVEGVWVLGGVERTESRKIFFVEVPNRSADTLLSIIRRHVAPGSIVYTDLWRGYAQLASALNLTHQTVNHSLYFKDPITGIHTNTIEGNWNGVKMRVAPRNRVKRSMDEFAGEMMWRRKHEADLWSGFITALRTVGYEDIE